MISFVTAITTATPTATTTCCNLPKKPLKHQQSPCRLIIKGKGKKSPMDNRTYGIDEDVRLFLKHLERQCYSIGTSSGYGKEELLKFMDDGLATISIILSI